MCVIEATVNNSNNDVIVFLPTSFDIKGVKFNTNLMVFDLDVGLEIDYLNEDM